VLKIAAIIQARMGSVRLPGKTMQLVYGKPLITYLIERLRHCNNLVKTILATSIDPGDDIIEDYCEKNDLICCRGDINNVAGRFYKILEKNDFDGFVRINGDSPFLDQNLVEKGINLFDKDKLDIITNVFPRTFPQGESVEVVSSNFFLQMYSMMKKEEELEHVTKYFYDNSEKFRIFNFKSDKDYGKIKLSIDTEQDMENCKKIISIMKKPHWQYDLDEIAEIYFSFDQ